MACPFLTHPWCTPRQPCCTIHWACLCCILCLRVSPQCMTWSLGSPPRTQILLPRPFCLLWTRVTNGKITQPTKDTAKWQIDRQTFRVFSVFVGHKKRKRTQKHEQQQQEKQNTTQSKYRIESTDCTGSWSTNECVRLACGLSLCSLKSCDDRQNHPWTKSLQTTSQSTNQSYLKQHWTPCNLDHLDFTSANIS